MYIGYTRYKQFKINLKPKKNVKGEMLPLPRLLTTKKSRKLIQITVKFQVFKKEITDLLILLNKCLQKKLAVLVLKSVRPGGSFQTMC